MSVHKLPDAINTVRFDLSSRLHRVECHEGLISANAVVRELAQYTEPIGGHEGGAKAEKLHDNSNRQSAKANS